jgi:hypothetical protein
MDPTNPQVLTITAVLAILVSGVFSGSRLRRVGVIYGGAAMFVVGDDDGADGGADAAHAARRHIPRLAGVTQSPPPAQS